MPSTINPLDLPFQSPFFETKPLVPCELLSDVIANQHPAPVVASEQPRKSNGHNRQVAVGPDSGGC
jgi:hypothetical protein